MIYFYWTIKNMNTLCLLSVEIRPECYIINYHNYLLNIIIGNQRREKYNDDNLEYTSIFTRSSKFVILSTGTLPHFGVDSKTEIDIICLIFSENLQENTMFKYAQPLHVGWEVPTKFWKLLKKIWTLMLEKQVKIWCGQFQKSSV